MYAFTNSGVNISMSCWRTFSISVSVPLIPGSTEEPLGASAFLAGRRDHVVGEHLGGVGVLGGEVDDELLAELLLEVHVEVHEGLVGRLDDVTLPSSSAAATTASHSADNAAAPEAALVAAGSSDMPSIATFGRPP
jgi:hypothetical protein